MKARSPSTPTCWTLRASFRTSSVNGAAARLVQKNDKVIVVTYGQLPEEEARQWSPTVVLLDDNNEIKRAA